MKIYISGKISGLSEKEYNKNFYNAKSKIYLDGIDGFNMILACQIISPLSINPIFGIKKWLFFMISDIAALRKCTHIAMQKNWIDSKGAVIEYFFAKFIFKQQIIWL